MTAPAPSPPDAYPDLEPGLNVLRGSDSRTSALHRLVVSELADPDRDGDGDAYWLDARNNASTYHLAEITEDRRLLRSLRIARAFTAYQHHALARTLTKNADSETSLVVAPAVADLYRDDDIPEPVDHQYCEAAVGLLAELGSVLDVPVLVTTGAEDSLADLVVDRAAQVIEYERTAFGYRYAADGFETLLYWDEDHWQTTIPYWVELFGSVESFAVESAYEVGLVDATV